MEKKLIRVLKMTAYYSLLGLFLQGLIVNVLLATSPIGGQNLSEIKIKVNAVNVSLEKAFQIIENKSNFRFSYSKEEIPIYHTVTIDTEEESMYDLLSNLAKEVGLTFNRVNNQIVVKKSDLGTVESINLPLDAVTFKGKVTDKNGEPLIGASVIITQIRVGSATDIEGNYQFEVNKDLVFGTTVELTASYVNYKKKVVKVAVSSNEVRQNFELEEDIFQNEEIVVTGIASRTSKSVAEVAVSRISAGELTAKQSFQNVSQLVSGKISGVKIDIASGNAGSGFQFFVRDGGGLNGTGQPLIYVDGVRIENVTFFGNTTMGQGVSTLANLNPADIENIEVLKGPAAAATYGTNASNGVVLITTKSGKMTASGGGGKGYQISYNYNYGMNSQAYKYPNTFFNADTINGILAADGLIREHTVGITGGTSNLRYYASYQNRFDAGAIPNENWIDRNTLRLNVTSYPSEQLSFKFNTSYATAKMHRPTNDNSVYGWLLNAFVYMPAYSRLNRYQIEVIKDNFVTNQFIGSGSISWKPISQLEINGSAGVDFNYIEDTRSYPVNMVYTGSWLGQKNFDTRKSTQMTYDFNAKYYFNDLLTNGLNVTLIVGSQLIERKTNTLGLTVQNYLHPDVTTLQAAKDITRRDDAQTNVRSAGIYTDNSFSYDDTYYLNLVLRRDYASSIGFEAPAITYPKIGASVRIDKFEFMPDEVALFKIRAAYGESGQLPANNDGLPLMYTARNAASGLGYDFTLIGNRAIEPERVTQLELGFDTEFLKIFSLEFTYYNSRAKNSIINTTLASSTGLGDYDYPFNIGETKGYGTETFLQINPIRTTDYDLNIGLIWNYQKNEVVNLGETREVVNGWTNVLRVGMPKWQFSDYVSTTPKYSTTGKYNGANQTADKVDLGSPYPDHFGSISLNFRFLKNFTLYSLIEWGVNNKVWSYTIRRAITAYAYAPVIPMQIQLGLVSSVAAAEYKKYGLYQDVLALTPGTPEYNAVAEKYAKYDPNVYGNFVYDADYITMRELSLSYDFTDLMKDFLPNSYISGISAGMSIRNVFKSTKYELDPEVNQGGGPGGQVANDFATLPQPRTYNFWVRLTF